MNCEEYQERILYLAEEDASMRMLLEEHLAFCSECRRSQEEYRAFLSAYRSLDVEDVPSFGMPVPSVLPWRLTRIAAVILFGLLLGFLWKKEAGPPVRPIVPETGVSTLSWDPPVAVYSSFAMNSENRDFETRIEYLQDAITKLKIQTSNNQF